jgi:hypothetical protein
MLLDALLPEFDASRTEHRIVPGDLEAVYRATREADFVRAWRESRAVRVMFALRAVGEQMVSWLARRPRAITAEPEHLRLGDLPRQGEWVLLGERAPTEIAFGVIGRFWSGETVWRQIDATQFASFDQRGFGKIACNFSLRPYGRRGTLVTYECRTHVTDARSRRGFMRYWRPLAPFIGVVMRAQLRVIEDQVGHGSA